MRSKQSNGLPRYRAAFCRALRRDRLNVVVVVVVGLALVVWLLLALGRVLKGEGLDFWTITEPVIGVATIVILILVWLKQMLELAEQEEEIDILLRFGGRELRLPYRPVRAQLSRAELQGILGVYYGNPRYDPKIIYQVTESPADGQSILNQVRSGRLDQLVIEVDREFFEQASKNLRAREVCATNRADSAMA